MAFDDKDAWERKTRARYKETDSSRRLFNIAADPDATATELDTAAHETLDHLNLQLSVLDACQSVADALAAHPNTPPVWFGKLIERSPFASRAFCNNPIAPFLLLEKPYFVSELNENAQYALLREADLPLPILQILAKTSGGARAQMEAICRAAHLHAGLTGEASAPQEWEAQAREEYRALCMETGDSIARNWHADLAEIGLAPGWADGGRPFDEPSLPELTKFHASHPIVEQWLRFDHEPGSHQETNLLRALFLRLEIQDEQVVAWGLRADASPKDLRAVLHGPAAKSDVIKEIALRHPAATPALVAEAMEEGTDARLIVSLPQTPPHVLADILQYHDPLIRRLARRHPNAPPDICEIARRGFGYIVADGGIDTRYPLVSLLACLHGAPPQENVPIKAEHFLWTQRFEAALLAPVGDAPLPGYEETRTGRELLDHLSRDGNRIVRGAAKTRLSDPEYRFTL